MRASIKWIPTALDPHKMIAEPTLQAVRTLLRGSGEAAPASGWKAAEEGVTVRIQDHPVLSEVGGVARVDSGPQAAVGVARIGRASYVAYEMTEQGLRELPVEVDPAGNMLRITQQRRRTEASNNTA